MTFLPDAFHAQGYDPDQIEMLQRVYESITAEPWFTNDPAKHDEFGSKVLEMYQRGMVIPDKLYLLCLLIAKNHYVQVSTAGEADEIPPIIRVPAI